MRTPPCSTSWLTGAAASTARWSMRCAPKRPIGSDRGPPDRPARDAPGRRALPDRGPRRRRGRRRAGVASAAAGRRGGAMSVEVELLEYTQVTKARKIDEEAGVLYDLAALGPSSANGRDYPEETQRRALPLLEGRQSFANHTKSGSGEPSVYDLLGGRS